MGQQSALLVGSDGTPPTVHWVEHIASCVVDRLSDMMVNAGLPVEEPGDSAADCVERPPWSAVAGRAAHLVAQWEGLEASLPPTSLVPLRCCRRMPLLCTCLTGLTHCACVFPNYSEPFYQLAQFCHRQGLDLVSSTPAQRVCLPHPSPSHTAGVPTAPHWPTSRGLPPRQGPAHPSPADEGQHLCGELVLWPAS